MSKHLAEPGSGHLSQHNDITQLLIAQAHLGDFLLTHQEHEDSSHNDGQANQHEGNVLHNVLLNTNRL